MHAAAFWVSLLSLARLAAVDKPNIIYIMADDLGYGDVGCYGQKKIRTPNIDRLAADGLRFTQFYSGSTVCAPTRSCLMTGQHTGHTWIRGNASPASATPQGRVPLRPEDVTVAEVLKGAGYATGIVGKWGLGEPETTGVPNRQGFDFWFGYLNQQHAHSYYPDYLWKNQERYEIPENKDGKRKIYSHDLMTRQALEFIEKNSDKPFFLYVAFTIPHGKHEVPDVVPYEKEEWPEPLKAYAAMITRMDRDIGTMMDLLKKLGLDENTIVFVTSDNGPELPAAVKFFDSNGPLRGHKRDLYEGGIRAPMVVRWPGKVKAGSTTEQVGASWDILPTLAEVAGDTSAPKDIDGVSILPAILGSEPKPRDFMYWEFHESGMSQAVRMGDWKAVRKEGGALELYDLRTDIGEASDVASDHPEVIARIEAYLKTARTDSLYWPAGAADKPNKKPKMNPKS